MKRLFSLIVVTIVILSCNNYSNIKVEDICGKRFTSSSSSSSGVGSNNTGTTLSCNGTFESGETTYVTGYNAVDRNHFTGTWQLVKDIPEDVKQAVTKFGLKNKDYSIIQYSSSNGVAGYCIYYCEEISNELTIQPLYLNQVSEYAYSEESGSLGIHGGHLKN